MLYCIDPETGDVILIVINEKKAIIVQATFRASHPVLDKEEKPYVTVDAMMSTKNEETIDAISQKQKTIDILKKIEFRYKKTRRRFTGRDELTISSPYLSVRVGSNEIILRRVQDILLSYHRHIFIFIIKSLSHPYRNIF